MALVSSMLEIVDDSTPQTSLESQNLPRCMHFDEINQFILEATKSGVININKLTNTVHIICF